MKRRFIAALVLASLFSRSASFTSARIDLDSGAQTSPAEHACCRHTHVPAMPRKLFGFVPHGTPCGKEHLCCTYRSPENRSSRPTVIRVPAPESARLSETAMFGHYDTDLAIAELPHNLQSYSLRSMVLRI
jgi:hypothetical protein